MVKGLYTAYTGMINEQHRMDTLTNNLANVTTTGFKKEGSTSQSFDALLAYKLKDSSISPRIPQNIGFNQPGVKIGENYTDYSQGSFKITDNTYDMALSGDGFFTIEFTNKAGETSTKYTRDGSFTLTQEGYLVTKDGDYVMGTNGRIRLDPVKDTVIDQQGNIFQDDALISRIRITDFENYDYLKKYGENMLEPVEGATYRNADYKLFSGYLEMSNVNTVTEMVDLIAITRQYEANQKIIKSIDSTLEVAANQLGRLG